MPHFPQKLSAVPRVLLEKANETVFSTNFDVKIGFSGVFCVHSSFLGSNGAILQLLWPIFGNVSRKKGCSLGLADFGAKIVQYLCPCITRINAGGQRVASVNHIYQRAGFFYQSFSFLGLADFWAKIVQYLCPYIRTLV